MGDDLASFFAKKKGKKHHVVKMQDVEQILEGKTKRQEEYDRETVDDKRNYDDDKTANGAEESEWIEYDNINQGRLEGLKIKDMGVIAETADEQHEDEENKEMRTEHVRTWGNLNGPKPEAPHSSEQTVSDQQMATQMTSAYKAPHLRGTTKYVPPGKRDVLDMNSDMSFPSLADASKIEKTKKEEKTSGGSGGGWSRAGAPTAESRESEKRAQQPWKPSINAEKEKAGLMNAVRTLTTQNPNSSAAPPAREPEPEKPKSVYVPPHLRGK